MMRPPPMPPCLPLYPESEWSGLILAYHADLREYERELTREMHFAAVWGGLMVAMGIATAYAPGWVIPAALLRLAVAS